MKVSISEPIKGELEIEGKEAEQFLSTIIPEAFKDGVGILNDIVKSWRWKNQVKILLKVQTFCQKNKIKPSTIPLKILLPLLEQSSLESEETLQNKWSALLIYASSGQEFEYTKSFMNILDQLTIIEASILNWVHAEIMKSPRVIFLLEDIKRIMNIDEEKLLIIFENFVRLGLFIEEQVGHGATHKGKFLGQGESSAVVITTFSSNGKYQITSFGKEFLKACIDEKV